MKSTKSSKQNTGTYAFTSIFRYDLRRFWAVPALFLLSLLVACPIACLLVTDPGKDRAVFVSTMIENQYPLTTFLCCTMALAMGIGVFEYIQKPRVANYMHSLPVRRRELFAANYITGTIMLFIPIAITALIMIPFAVANSGGIVEVEPAGLFVWMIMSWLLSAVIFAITVFAGMVSGTVFMHLFNSLFFCFVVVMLIAVVDQYASMMLYGYTQSEAIGRLILNSMPFVALYGPPRVSLTVIYIIMWIALSLLAACIYSRRAIENTGESLVFTWTKSLIIGVVSFIGTCYMGVIFRELTDAGEGSRMNVGMVIGMAFGFAATFLVISLIVYKGPRIFGRHNLMTAGIVIAVTILFSGAFAGDVIGYEKKTLDADHIKAATTDVFTFEYGSRYDPKLFNNGETFDVAGSNGEYALKFEDRENIETICRIQKKLLNIHNENGQAGSVDVSGQSPGYEETYKTISVTATTDSGATIRRSYEDIDENTYELIKDDVASLYESEEFKRVFALTNLRYNIDKIYMYVGATDELEEIEFKKDQFEDFTKAMQKDFETMTFAQQEEAKRAILDEKVREPYYDVYIVLNYEDEPEMQITVTKDQKNAWKWIRTELL